ncbi:hypothetical protein SAMN04244572_04354 [Azotobacter beijerinckii]|uniref:Uncharacterized protein n=1 Tax=Azotobacter beijerinckii TaxID=170623 RepID=A0A1H6ZLD8_9GAMM|nr:hypothetical protein [Azotobacter beijerinckii]SEJ52954.1 hypothetical protein SAMN04244572_04354 [Azotobacter beijerinckii]
MADMQEVIRLRREGKFAELSAMGIQITGGSAAGQKSGWFKAPFSGEKAHYFTETASDAIGEHGRHRFWKAACGAEAVSHDKAPMFFEGNFERCAKCKTIRGRIRRG